MTLRPFTIGRLFGFRITLNPTFLFLLVLLSLNFAWGWSDRLLGFVVGLVCLLLVFVCVLFHELGHSLVARRLGVEIVEIELHLFGGAAKLLSSPKTPGDEILITAAGPLTSFLLAGLFFGLGQLVADPLEVVELLLQANLMLGAVNLVPAFPLDGGRLLRAVLASRLGMLRATRAAVLVSRFISALVVSTALIPLGLSQREPFLAALAGFVWILASKELHVVEALERTNESLGVYDRSGRLVRPGLVDGGAEAGQQLHWSEGQPEVPDDAAGQRVAMVRGSDGRSWIVTER